MKNDEPLRLNWIIEGQIGLINVVKELKDYQLLSQIDEVIESKVLKDWQLRHLQKTHDQ